MSQFGWTIEYTLGLNWPVFIELALMLGKIRLDNAVDSMYIPYCAGKYGEKSAKMLFDGRGSFFLEDEADYDCGYDGYTEDDLKKANERMRKILSEREQAFAGLIEK